jgi:choline dehydrogenase-like flavoprotein
MSGNFDIIIVGAGSAGCVMAAQLSADPSLNVLLLEAGPEDKNVLITMPKGSGKILSDPKYCHYFPTEKAARFAGSLPETWVRGKVLGGSSAVNGMVYHRGAPEDYDRFAELGLTGWSWRDMLPYFMAVEDHELPATEFRGKGGPIPLRMHKRRTRLSAAMIEAAQSLGLPYKEDPNLPKVEGIAYIAANISATGKRVSAAAGFLNPSVRRRPNLAVETGITVQRILFDGRRATGIAALAGDAPVTYNAGLEIIICAGAIQSPQLLQVSGIGPAEHLAALGVDVIQHSPLVGGNLREHYLAFLQFRLKHVSDSENRQYSGWRLAKNAAQYMLTGGGLLADAPWHMSAFVRSLPESTRPDTQLTFAPFSLDPDSLGAGAVMETQPGMQFFGYPSRATSQGTIRAQSVDMRLPPKIDPNYLDTDYDKRLSTGLVNYVRRFMAAPALAPYVLAENPATAHARTDDEILALMRQRGQTGYHANGTVHMGADATAPLDARLRVRGVTNLRVMDASVLPEQVSGNTNAPVMAMAWRGADMILEDHNRRRSVPADRRAA